MQLRTRLVNSIESNLKFWKLFSNHHTSWIHCSVIKTLFRKRSALTLFTRAAKHMGISNWTGKRLECVKQLAVSDHLFECNYSIDFDHFDILASDTNRFRLLIKESLLIKRDQPQLNKTIKSFPLKTFWLRHSFIQFSRKWIAELTVRSCCT